MSLALSSVRALLFMSFFSIIPSLLGQDRCGFMPQSEMQEEVFEEWMNEKVKTSKQDFRILSSSQIYIVPVVFHIIHNGEAEGFGENISTSRILDQMDRLNEDFRGNNPNGAPSLFQSVFADVEVEFVLAKQDPDGYPTTGIVRKQGSRTSYNLFVHDRILKETSYWDSEKYLNVWVAETGSTIGLATWPDTSLPGSNPPPSNPIYDGVIVDDDFIGTNLNTDGSFESYGQTLTHEIGHFLGLRHVWGDSSCGNDYCDDTPQSDGHHGNSGDLPVISPCIFPGPDSCSDSEPDMFMNFMDYTNDECLSMFTLDQKFRMRTVLENSPRRLSLLTSPGLEVPIGVYDNDIALSSIENVPLISCASVVTARMNVLNYGKNSISSFDIDYDINGSTGTIQIDNVNIALGENYEADIEFTGLLDGKNEITIQLSNPNGVTDENSLNNSQSFQSYFDTETITSPFRENFEFNSWISTNQSGTSEWETYSSAGNRSYTIQAFEGGTVQTESALISPVFSLADFDEAGFFFDLSYGIDSSVDNLKVGIQSGCSGDFTTIYNKDLNSLDFPRSNTAWTPGTNWIEQFINLTAYKGLDELRIGFFFTNKGGNNLYLDNLELTNNNDPDQPRLSEGRMVVYPSPANSSFNITISLPTTQDVRLDIIDVSGARVRSELFTNILNHTVTIDTGSLFGLYFIKVSGKDINKIQRLLINR